MTPTIGYGKSAYSLTGYGKMRSRNSGCNNVRKHSERGMCNYKVASRTNYDLRNDLNSLLSNWK